MGSIKASLSRAALAVALSCAVAFPSFAQDASVAEQTIDAMHKLWGQHPGIRANHAKGVVVEGSFTPTDAAAKLSKAPLFQGKPVPVTARFSDSTGLPAIPDGSPDANPHGVAVKFRLPGGEVDVHSHEGRFIARGVFNPNSAVRVRLYRWDGGELDAMQLAERMMESIARPLEVEGHELYTTATIGLALGVAFAIGMRITSMSPSRVTVRSSAIASASISPSPIAGYAPRGPGEGARFQSRDPDLRASV